MRIKEGDLLLKVFRITAVSLFFCDVICAIDGQTTGLIDGNEDIRYLYTNNYRERNSSSLKK